MYVSIIIMIINLSYKYKMTFCLINKQSQNIVPVFVENILHTTLFLSLSLSKNLSIHYWWQVWKIERDEWMKISWLCMKSVVIPQFYQMVIDFLLVEVRVLLVFVQDINKKMYPVKGLKVCWRFSGIPGLTLFITLSYEDKN